MNGLRNWMRWGLLIVASITLLSATAQFLAPGPALAFMGLGADDAAIYLFRLLSLLVGLFGGALLYAAMTSQFESAVLVWASLQKLFSAVAMLFGVTSGLLASQVLFVAGYDFAAGLCVLWFSRRGRG
jgi:hypothetical protein